MTRAQLEAVIEALVEIVDAWNEAAADDDRGRSNDALCLTLWDDGSGRLGRRAFLGQGVEDWHDFDDLDGLVQVLQNEGAALEEPPC